MDIPLQRGHELRCPHCGRWHRVIVRHTEGTDYTQRMLYWECRTRVYYAGQIGTAARFPTRAATTLTTP
jgi:hypothetical protein